MNTLVQALQQKKEEGKLLEIAQTAGLHYSTLYRIINGEREPQMSTIRKLLKVYPELAPDLAAIFTPENPPTGDSIRQLA